jgi:drug/metabolite transporter (DMT)-like permease
LLAVVASKPRLAALLGAGCIAFSGIFFRFSGVSPSTATVFRCLYALPLLYLLASQEDRREGPRAARERWLAVGAGVFFAFDLLAYHHAVEEVGAGLGTVLPNLQVVFVAIAGWILWRERPTGRVLAALPLAIAGAILISGVFERSAYGRNPGLGVAFGLTAAVSYGAFLLVIRHGNRSGARSFGTLLDASAATVVVAIAAGLIVGDLDLVPTFPAHAWLLLLALTSQVAGYGFINISLPRLPAVLTSVLLLAQPVATVILGALLLGEAPSPGQLLGVVALLAGLAVASLPVGRVRSQLRTATD